MNHTGQKAKLERLIKSNKQTRNQPEVPVSSPDFPYKVGLLFTSRVLMVLCDFRSSIHLQLTDAFSHKLVCLCDGAGGVGLAYSPAGDLLTSS